MRYEDDIPTKKETESESSRFQKQNEHSRMKTCSIVVWTL